ncbi:MAG: rhamnulokinase family protein [candidate division WOR-3 bacterium]
MKSSRKPQTRFLAIDLGTESGRAVAGTLKAGKLAVEEIHRFPNRMVNVHGHWYWDIWHLYEEIKQAMRAYAKLARTRLQTIGIDTWGVDFGLLASDGSILGLPFSYRDPRTRGMIPKFQKLVPRQRIYELTGIQFMNVNTLYQLYSMVREKSPLLDVASDLLFMPDLFNYLLTGQKATEFTFATTSQLYNPFKQEWAGELFKAVGVPVKLMQRVVRPGSIIGKVLPRVCEETGFPRCPVVATTSHDTAAAVAAIPAQGNDWAYISSGTWSLVGVETSRPNTSEAAFKHNFTNEGGIGGTFRLLKNVTGLWLLRRCLDEWNERGQLNYDSFLKAVARQPFPETLLDPDWPQFAYPGSMTSLVDRYCDQTGQKVPFWPREFGSVILTSLALKYRWVLDKLRALHKHPIRRIHIVGGGSKNGLLCQMAADATGLPVYAGPAEATAIGNVMVQAMALGLVSSPQEIRQVVRASFKVKEYTPGPSRQWDKAYERFCEIAG